VIPLKFREKAFGAWEESSPPEGDVARAILSNRGSPDIHRAYLRLKNKLHLFFSVFR